MPVADVTELLPCPFCGGEGDTFRPTCDQRTPYDPTDRAYPVARCRDCYAEVPGKNWDDSCRSAIAAWNTRAAPPAMDREAVEKIREAAGAMLPKNVCLTNPRWPDETVVPLETTLGELRALSAALSTLSADAIHQGEGEVFTGVEAWDELVNVDDRTSPEEYPDMCLITRDELIDFMSRTTPASHASDGGKP